jgi:hypothetical protein
MVHSIITSSRFADPIRISIWGAIRKPCLKSISLLGLMYKVTVINTHFNASSRRFVRVVKECDSSVKACLPKSGFSWEQFPRGFESLRRQLFLYIDATRNMGATWDLAGLYFTNCERQTVCLPYKRNINASNSYKYA